MKRLLESKQAKAVLRKTASGVHDVAFFTDELLSVFITPAIDALYTEARNKALLLDEKYREIEKRRESGSSGDFKVFLSEEMDLGWDEIDYQREVEERYMRRAWWKGPARVLADRPLSTIYRKVAFGYQRLSRSWDDSAVWSLDTHLAATLGAQLIKLADEHNGWPEGLYKTPGEWEAALRKNGQALLAYQGIYTLEGDSEEETMKQAKEALRWVADNFEALWD